jgi:hypothetical protein
LPNALRAYNAACQLQPGSHLAPDRHQPALHAHLIGR